MADNSPKTADFLLIPLGFMQKTCVFNLEKKKRNRDFRLRLYENVLSFLSVDYRTDR